MGNIVLLDLVGGIALLLWGLHMVQSCVYRKRHPVMISEMASKIPCFCASIPCSSEIIPCSFA